MILLKCSNINNNINNNKINENLDTLYVENQNINIEELKEQIAKNPYKIIIFKECYFNNFASLLKKIINYCKATKIITIKFINCLPNEELKQYKNSKYNNIEVKFDHQAIEMKANYRINNSNNNFINIKKPDFIGFSIEYNKLSLFVDPAINFFALYSNYTHYEYMFNSYIINDFISDDIIPVNSNNIRYIFYSSKVNFFSDFYKALQKRLSKAEFIKYNIIIFQDQIEQKEFIQDFKDFFLEETLKKWQFKSLFLSSSSIFNFPIDKYILNFPSNIKKDIKAHFNKMEKNSHENFVINSKDQACAYGMANGRYIALVNMFLCENRNVLKNFINLKEKVILNKYNSLGINFLIYQMITNNKLTKEQAIDKIISYFMEYITLV